LCCFVLKVKAKYHRSVIWNHSLDGIYRGLKYVLVTAKKFCVYLTHILNELICKRMDSSMKNVMAVIVGASLMAPITASFAQSNDKVIGVSVRTWQMGRFTDLIVPVVKKYAEEAGYRIVLKSAENSLDKQVSDIENFMEEGVDGVVVGLVNGDGGSRVSTAMESDVPLVYMNVPPINIDSLPDNQMYVGPDETATGIAQAEAACAALGGSGKVGLLIGDLLHPAAAARTKAVQETIQSRACYGVELVFEETAQWNREFASEVTQEWIDSGEGIGAIIANNDGMALGAIDAYLQVGIDMDEIFVTGVDGGRDALESVQKNHLDMTLLQDLSEQGSAIFSMFERMKNGEPVESTHLMPMTEVTISNVESFLD